MSHGLEDSLRGHWGSLDSLIARGRTAARLAEFVELMLLMSCSSSWRPALDGVWVSAHASMMKKSLKKSREKSPKNPRKNDRKNGPKNGLSGGSEKGLKKPFSGVKNDLQEDDEILTKNREKFFAKFCDVKKIDLTGRKISLDQAPHMRLRGEIS